MTLGKSKPQSSARKSSSVGIDKIISFLSPTFPWFDKIVAILALANYFLVLFDVSYIPLRDFWLQGRLQFFIKVGPIEREFPSPPWKVLPFPVTNWYDWVKGIEPYRDTQEYLKRVQDLNEKINQNALQSAGKKQQDTQTETVEIILADLRQRSVRMIDENPFQIANKTGTLERIKNKMREHIFGTEDASAKEAFILFWSEDNLSKKGLRPELNFFDSEIAPLIATNYYRPVGENGEHVNNFGLLDLPFFLIFFTDFLARTWYVSRRYTGVSWFDAMLWRWYDIFLLIPVFRILRIIPVIVRLNQTHLINLKAIEKQSRQGFVASIAEDITQVIVIQVIDRLQDSIQAGEISNWLSEREDTPYIDLNEVNETAELFKLTLDTTIQKVLPQVRPDIEALIKYNIENILAQAPLHQGLQNLPGVKNLENQIAQQTSTRIYQIFADVITNLFREDPAFEALLQKLFANFSKSMGAEIQAKHSLERIQSLLTDLLEEIKVNYVQKLSEQDVESLLEQTRALRQGVKS